MFCLWSAPFFWRSTFGGAVAKLWDLGPFGVVLLLLFIGVLAGPLLGLLGQIAAAGYRRVRDASRQMRFRSQREWRIEAAQLLDAQPLFDDLSVETLNDIAGRVQLRTVAAATAVVRQGDAADAYYLVRSGSLDVVEEDADAGTERVIHTLDAGESFGESGVATGARRNATVRATTRSELFVIDKSAFDRLLADRIRLPELTPTVQALAELRALPPFAELGNADLDRLRQYGTWLTVAPDTTVIEHGEPGDAFYVIESGQVEVTRDGVPLATLHAGQHFGDTALLTRRPRNATVRTVTPTRMFRLDPDDFHALVAQTFRQRRDAGPRNESITFSSRIASCRTPRTGAPVDCWHCHRNAVGTCRFCGRGICENHVQTRPYRPRPPHEPEAHPGPGGGGRTLLRCVPPPTRPNRAARAGLRWLVRRLITYRVRNLLRTVKKSRSVAEITIGMRGSGVHWPADVASDATNRTGGSRMLLDELLAERERAEMPPTPPPVLSVDPVAVPPTVETGRRAINASGSRSSRTWPRRNYRSAEEARRVLADEHQRLEQELNARTHAQHEAAGPAPRARAAQHRRGIAPHTRRSVPRRARGARPRLPTS